MKFRYKFLLGIFSLLLIGFIIPERKIIPVEGATRSDWNADTFWYDPWGSSGVHKGIDIFSKKGTSVIAATDMLILHRASISKGGNIIVGLGAKWRLHYYAHLEKIDDNAGLFVSMGESIGFVGATGNAKGKQPHLHYSILSIIPLPWLIDRSSQGYKKAFYLNPIEYFNESEA